MSITLTLGQLVGARIALARLADRDLPMAVAIDILRLIRAANAELALFDERNHKLIVDLGAERPRTPNDPPGLSQTIVAVRPENADRYAAALTELMAVEVTLPITPIALGGLAQAAIRPSDLLALGLYEPWALVAVDVDAPKRGKQQGKKSI